MSVAPQGAPASHTRPRSMAVISGPFPTGTPRRIHIVGGPGGGKTSLAIRLASRTGLPVHHLDDVARVGGGTGAVRTAEERQPLIAKILAQDAWITEGVHLDWTAPFLERADLIVWLDCVSWPRATRRIVRRFISGAWHELRTRKGRQRFARFGDYARNLRSLGGAILETRQYYAEDDPAADLGAANADLTAPDADADLGAANRLAPPGPARVPVSATLDSRGATAAFLARYRAKLVHCRDAPAVNALVQAFERPRGLRA